MSRHLPPCSQMAALMVLIGMILRGVTSKAFPEGRISIRRAIDDLKSIEEPWRIVCSKNSFADNQKLSVDRDDVRCSDLNLAILPQVIHDLEVSQRYVHFLEGTDYDFGENCAHFQTSNQPTGSLTNRVGDLIHHLNETMGHCSFNNRVSTGISCDVINDGQDVEFPRRVETSLRHTRNFFTST
ncbi:uncharacterized protein LOC117335556 [Pecten maximus]|uniref:uncharacterized protein LOC117335556 n=1 Tax=Pecten maximus TaxID=6579 RepID=UPI0014588EDD|nr:uncharacterized protein LOC117335556 [Pecten maximus]